MKKTVFYCLIAMLIILFINCKKSDKKINFNEYIKEIENSNIFLFQKEYKIKWWSRIRPNGVYTVSYDNNKIIKFSLRKDFTYIIFEEYINNEKQEKTEIVKKIVLIRDKIKKVIITTPEQ